MAVIEIVMPGASARKAGMRGESQSWAIAGKVAICTTCGAAASRRSRAALAIASKAAANPGSACWPIAVSITPLAVRSNSRAPSKPSSDLTCAVTAPGVTPSSLAAARNPPNRAAASKARKAFRGKSGGFGGRTAMDASIFLTLEFRKSDLRATRMLRQIPAPKGVSQ
jgi:hypothetical protein